MQRPVIGKWHGFVCYREKSERKTAFYFFAVNATGHVKPKQPSMNQLLLLKVKETNLC